MPNLVTKQFKISNAKSFIQQFSGTDNSLYMFFAKPTVWSTSSETPPDPEDTQQSFYKLWDEIISLKKIPNVNMIPVVKRINWESGSIYAEYDHEDVDLLSKRFYVMNDEYDVYKCIDNNDGKPSSVKPTGKNLNIFSTSDGYKWKYLFSVSTSDRLKFLTDNWLPVRKNDEVAAVARDGAIENIKLFNGGIDYSVKANVVILGDGANAKIGVRQSLGVVYDFVFENYGDGYRFANAYVADYFPSRGRGANIRAILSPLGGHGSDPVKELGAHYVMLFTKTEYNEGFGDFPGGFSYRKLGLLKNPINRYSTIANSATLSALTGISVSNVNGAFLKDEFFEGISSNANAYLVTSNIAGGNGYIKYIQLDGLTSNYTKFRFGETIIGKLSGATASVGNVIISDVVSDTGELLYVENRFPVARVSDQTDTLHLVLEF